MVAAAAAVVVVAMSSLLLLQLLSVLIMEATTIGGRAGRRLLMLLGRRLIANRKLAAALVLQVSSVIHVRINSEVSVDKSIHHGVLRRVRAPEVAGFGTPFCGNLHSFCFLRARPTLSLFMVPAIPAGATCLFCLDGGLDNTETPLVRDCSCRGDAAGFVHLPCLIEYAEQKSRQATTDSPDFIAVTFADPWKKCLNCHQPYQNKLALDLGSAFVSFADATYGHTEDMTWDKLRVITALQAKIEHLVKLDENRTECLTNLDRMISMIRQIKTNLKMSRWLFESQDSFEYKFYVTVCGEFEAPAYEVYGISTMSVNTVTGYTQALSYFKMASIIYSLLLSRTESEENRHNLSVQSERMENKIDLVKKLLAELTNSGEDRNMDKFDEVRKAKEEYEDSIKAYGLNSLQALYNGLTYVKIMQHVNQFIKAERFLTDLVARSRLVHGPEHVCTVEADKLLVKCKTRYVAIKPENEGVNDADKKNAETFQAIRYENNDEICVVTGPINEPRHEDDENTIHVEIQRIYPLVGCPVMVLEFERGRHFVNRVQARFVNQPHIHEAFLGIMDEWETIGVPSVLEQVSTLFADHRDLLLDFTQFLPQEIRNEAYERLNRAAPEAVTKGTTAMEAEEQQQDGLVGGSSDFEPKGILGTVIGHVTDDENGTQLLVHFEIDLKDMCIKPENVRIVFELPDKDA